MTDEPRPAPPSPNGVRAALSDPHTAKLAGFDDESAPAIFRAACDAWADRETAGNDPYDRAAMAAALRAGLAELGRQLHAQADYWTTLKPKRGAETAASQRRQAAAFVVAAAQRFDSFSPEPPAGTVAALLDEPAAPAQRDAYAGISCGRLDPTLANPAVAPCIRRDAHSKCIALSGRAWPYDAGVEPTPGVTAPTTQSVTVADQAAAYLSGDVDTYPVAAPAPAQPVPASANGANHLIESGRPESTSEAGAGNVSSITVTSVVDPGGPGARAPRELFPLTKLATPPAEPREFRSWSQLTEYEDCGARVRIRRDVAELPAWWNVAGNALHSLVEQTERQILDWQHEPDAENKTERIARIPLAWATAEIWEPAFDQAIFALELTSGVPRSEWRTAAKGAEGYDWWRVSGLDMLKRYASYRADVLTTHPGIQLLTVPSFDSEPGRFDAPVLEWEATIQLTTPQAGAIPVKVVIDQAWIHPDGSIAVVDLKFGKSTPIDVAQLELYAVALGLAGALPRDERGRWPRVSVAHYLGRPGKFANEQDVDLAAAYDRLAYRFGEMHRGERAGIYPARVSSFCTSCSVGDVCPLNPRRAS